MERFKKRDAVSRSSFSNQTAKRSGKILKNLSEKFLTKMPRSGLVELFPLKRKLFEIYFVRLIGTPNQQFNYRYAVLSKISTTVVQNH